MQAARHQPVGTYVGTVIVVFEAMSIILAFETLSITITLPMDEKRV
jgi:hypothetical protein